jgi:hypothetical protein
MHPGRGGLTLPSGDPNIFRQVCGMRWIAAVFLDVYLLAP